jgi:hypothetical protein
MPFPNQDYSKRDPSLPEGVKDLAASIKYEQASHLPAIPDPRVTRQVVLPDMVSVAYIVEVSRASAYAIDMVMREMRVRSDVGRSVEFEIAAKILRKYGVVAIRAA